MYRNMLKSKIHRATVTHSDLHYVGSITIDLTLMREAHLLPNEQVDVLNVTTGSRLTTYVIPGESNSGVIGINGAAAHLVTVGDVVIIVSYCIIDGSEIDRFRPDVVFVNAENRLMSIGHDPCTLAGYSGSALLTPPLAATHAQANQVLPRHQSVVE